MRKYRSVKGVGLLRPVCGAGGIREQYVFYNFLAWYGRTVYMLSCGGVRQKILIWSTFDVCRKAVKVLSLRFLLPFVSLTNSARMTIMRFYEGCSLHVLRAKGVHSVDTFRHYGVIADHADRHSKTEELLLRPS